MLVKQCNKPSIFLDCLYIHVKMVNSGRVDLIALLTLYIYIYASMCVCICIYIYIQFIPSIDQY